MKPPVFSDFYAFFDDINLLLMREEFELARAQLSRGQDCYPDWQWLITHTRAGIAARTGEINQALRLLAEALDEGHWLPDGFWEAAELSALHRRPEFKKLHARGLAQAAEAQRQTQPELLVRLPAADAAPPFPLLIGLHGHGSNSIQPARFWRPAATHGWLVALPQASQTFAPGTYTWGRSEPAQAQSAAEVREHFEALCRAYPVDAARVVLSGFSLGAELAIALALQGTIPARGFIAVATGGARTYDLVQWQPLIDRARGKSLRGVLIVGGQDGLPHVEGARHLAARLREAGFACRLEEHPHQGHAFPPDFAHRLPELLAYVLDA